MQIIKRNVRKRQWYLENDFSTFLVRQSQFLVYEFGRFNPKIKPQIPNLYILNLTI